MTKSNNILWRVTELEKNYRELDKNVNDILQNHLPHIQEQLISIKTRVSVLTVVNVGAIILGLLVSKIL